MNSAERLMTSVGMGLGTAALVFVGVETLHHWDPAETRQQQVDACAPSIPLEGEKAAVDLPRACAPFADELKKYDEQFISTYDIPTRSEFISRFTPGEGYNTVHMRKYGGLALAAGSVVGSLSAVALWIQATPLESTPDAPTPNQPTPKPPTVLTVKEYRRRYADKANNFRLDDLENTVELTRYINTRQADQQ